MSPETKEEVVEQSEEKDLSKGSADITAADMPGFSDEKIGDDTDFTYYDDEEIEKEEEEGKEKEEEGKKEEEDKTEKTEETSERSEEGIDTTKDADEIIAQLTKDLAKGAAGQTSITEEPEKVKEPEPKPSTAADKEPAAEPKVLSAEELEKLPVAEQVKYAVGQMFGSELKQAQGQVAEMRNDQAFGKLLGYFPEEDRQAVVAMRPDLQGMIDKAMEGGLSFEAAYMLMDYNDAYDRRYKQGFLDATKHAQKQLEASTESGEAGGTVREAATEEEPKGVMDFAEASSAAMKAHGF